MKKNETGVIIYGIMGFNFGQTVDIVFEDDSADIYDIIPHGYKRMLAYPRTMILKTTELPLYTE